MMPGKKEREIDVIYAWEKRRESPCFKEKKREKVYLCPLKKVHATRLGSG